MYHNVGCSIGKESAFGPTSSCLIGVECSLLIGLLKWGYSQLWPKTTHKFRKEIIEASIKEGGLKMESLFLFSQTLKIVWMRILASTSCTYLGQALSDYIGPCTRPTLTYWRTSFALLNRISLPKSININTF